MSSRPFKPYMGKNTFGTLKESSESGEYTLNKNANSIFCSSNLCIPSITVATQSDRLLLRKSINNYFIKSVKGSYNKANLNVNLVTKLNLTNVHVIQQNKPYAVPAYLDIKSIPYLDYTIDPSGNLFGNTICGTNNFQNYLEYNPPYKTSNSGHINNL